MSVLEQVEYETGVRRQYAAVAFAAGLLIVISQLLQLSGSKADVQEVTLTLVVDSARTTKDIIGATLQALGYVGLGVMLVWLQRIVRARQPEGRQIARYTAIAGVALTAILLVAFTIVFSIKAHEFVNSGNQGYPEANRLTSGGYLLVLQLLVELGELLLAIGVVLTVLGAMRVGLLTRGLGYTGIIAGALVIFPIGGIAPLFQAIWLVAVAVLLYGRWPSGDPPAWESGVSVPWTPMQQTTGAARQRREPRPRQQRRTRMDQLPTITEPAPDTTEPKRTPQKRKRKRRN